MGANVATVVCPLGPRVRSFVGRADSAVVNRVDLLPSPFSEAVDLIRLFRDKTISPHALVALLGAHTTSQQRLTNATRAGDPQDSTPGVWDVLYYEETYGTVETPERVFKFPSDVSLAKYSVTATEWVSFLGSGGQEHWNMVSGWGVLRYCSSRRDSANATYRTMPEHISAFLCSALVISTNLRSAPKPYRRELWSTKTRISRAWMSG